MRSACIRCILLAAVLWMSAQASAAQTPPAVVGIWRVVVPPEAPSSCKDLTVEFRRDGTMLTRSGAVVATKTYLARSERGGWLLVIDNVHTSEQSNCQALPA